MSEHNHDIDGEDLLAAEFALGLLDADARRNAEARMRSDAAFAADVARWDARFAPWLDAVAPVQAPVDGWQRLRASLWSHELPSRGSVPAARSSRWPALAIWRGVAIGAIAATAASVAMLALVLQRPPAALPPPVVVTAPPAKAAPMAVVLRGDDGSVAYTATLDADGMLVVMPVQAHADARAPELWLIPPGGAPQSMGMLARDRAMAMRIPARLLASARDGLFAVSMEPPGSGPHAAPTGPVVAKGAAIAL